MDFAKLDDFEIAYHDIGEGHPLLLVHAFPMHSGMWLPQLQTLQSQCRVIAPDLRGFGQSTLGSAPRSMRTYAKDLADLLDRLGIERVAVCGLSMGGYVAMAMLADHPERIDALVLADTRGGPDSPSGREDRLRTAGQVESEGSEAAITAMLPKLLGPSAPENLRDEVLQIMRSNGAPAIAAALRSMAARPDSSPTLRSARVRSLVIVGSKDVITPPEEARRLHADLRDSLLVEIPDAGHLTNLESPTVFGRAVQTFLDQR